MAAVPPDGVFVPVPTFFKPADGALQPAVDVEAQVAHSVYLAKCGITGLVLLGSTGEAIHLNRQERSDLVAGVRKGLDDAGFPNYPIMAGVLINGMEEVLEWLEDFKKAGAQWGLVLAPGYFGAAASQANLIKWYTIVADKSPLPVLMCVQTRRDEHEVLIYKQIQLPRSDEQCHHQPRIILDTGEASKHRWLQDASTKHFHSATRLLTVCVPGRTAMFHTTCKCLSAHRLTQRTFESTLGLVNN